MRPAGCGVVSEGQLEFHSFGKYEVLEEIGQGAMGVVYRAHDPVLDREVAIKTISASLGKDDELRKRIDIDRCAQQLCNFLRASVELMQVMARACGHTHLGQFCADDLTTWKKDMAELSGVAYAGVSSLG